jgi:hypothetical protein
MWIIGFFLFRFFSLESFWYGFCGCGWIGVAMGWGVNWMVWDGEGVCIYLMENISTRLAEPAEMREITQYQIRGWR